jgi:hypothetical protein
VNGPGNYQRCPEREKDEHLEHLPLLKVMNLLMD